METSSFTEEIEPTEWGWVWSPSIFIVHSKQLKFEFAFNMGEDGRGGVS